jgi:hypothetical protein
MVLRSSVVGLCVSVAAVMVALVTYERSRSTPRPPGTAMHPGSTGVRIPAGAQDAEPSWLGSGRTNAELMASQYEVSIDAAADRAIDLPVEETGALAPSPSLTFPAVPPTGLHVDLTFVAATGEGVPDTMGAVGPTQ